MLERQKKLTRSFFALLSLPATAMGFALSVQISALSWILSTKYGLEIHDVGLVWAAGPVAGILGQVVIGIISDNVWFWNGRRRPFILIGGVLAALMLLALPSLDVISSAMGIDGILGVAIAVALTLDLAINVSFNPTRSIIADVTPEGENRTKGYTWMQTISGTFGVLAYVIGAVWNNFALIYFGVGLVLVFSVIPPFFIEEPRELRTGTAAGGTKTSSSVRDVIMSIEPLWGFLIYAVYAMTVRLAHLEVGNHYVEYACAAITVVLIGKALLASEAGKTKEAAGLIGFKKVLAAHSFTWIGIQAMFIYLFAYVQDKMPELSDIEMGRVVSISFLVLNAVGAVLPVLVLEPITEKIGRVKTHLACIAIMAAGYAGILFFGFTPMMIYVLMGVVGVGWAATVSLPFAIMSQKVDQAKMGLYMGLFNLSVVLPQLVASLGVGEAVSSAENKSLLFIICAVSLALSALAWMLVKEDERGRDNAEPTATAGGGH
ncbi:MAG: MFS transporter [Rhodothermales bacterium]